MRNKIGFDQNAYAQESQTGPCADGWLSALSQILTRPVQTNTPSHRPPPEGGSVGRFAGYGSYSTPDPRRARRLTNFVFSGLERRT